MKRDGCAGDDPPRVMRLIHDGAVAFNATERAGLIVIDCMFQ